MLALQARRRKSEWQKGHAESACFNQPLQQSHTTHFLYLTGQNLVSLPHLVSGEAGKTTLCSGQQCDWLRVRVLLRREKYTWILRGSWWPLLQKMIGILPDLSIRCQQMGNYGLGGEKEGLCWRNPRRRVGDRRVRLCR